MAQPTPDPDRDRPFPWEHDEDPEQPGVTIRPLSHADLAALLAHIDHQPEELTTPVRDGDHRPGRTEPVVAIRVRAAVGRPGGSADAEYQRRWAAERAAWARTLPLRLAGVLTAGAGAALFAGRLADHLAVAAGLFVAAGVGWALRFRPSAETLAWRRGAAGERRTARLLQPLERHGWTVLHDLAIPGSRQHRLPGDRPRWGGADRQQAVPRAAAAGRLRQPVARPPPAGHDRPGGPVGGRPGRRGPGRRRGPRGRGRGRPRRQRPLGRGHRRRRHGAAGRPGPRPAARPAGGAGPAAGRLVGRPGPPALPPGRLSRRPAQQTASQL